MDSILGFRITLATRYSAIQKTAWNLTPVWQDFTNFCRFKAGIRWSPSILNQVRGQQSNDKLDYVVKHIKIYIQFQCLWFSSLKNTSVYATLFHGIIVSVGVNSTVQFRQEDPTHVISLEEFGIDFII